MAKSNRVLAVDIGAASIKIAEFEYAANGRILLLAFDYQEYGEELSDENRSFTISSVLGDILARNNFAARQALICLSGQFALTRFVKLPPVSEEESRVRQIVEFEARQNVPFPMEEVIWDYQLIANPRAEELEVMFVVIKNEIVEEITAAVQNAGLTAQAVDVAPCACYNAARANNVGDTECEIILNIGDRSTNLLFADRQQFFARTIPIAGHTITQQIAKEFGIDMDEAEEMKRRHGFVALGGAYAEPESEVASAVSKIVRNVMTRLHGEINRSIGVYRAQQKGTAPARLFLTGGSSTMNYADVFFQDKLNMEVEFLNPFKVVQLGPGIDANRLQEVAHMFSEVVGLGLHYRRQLPVEVNLVPENIRRQMAGRQKKPYLVASVACILLILVLALLGVVRQKQTYQAIYQDWRDDRMRLQTLKSNFVEREDKLASFSKDYEKIETVLQQREKWPAILNEIERLAPDNLWIYSLEPVLQEPGMQDMQDLEEEREAGPREGRRSLFGVEPGAPPMPSARPRFGPPGEDMQLTDMEPLVVTDVVLRGHSLVIGDNMQSPGEDAENEPTNRDMANEPGTASSEAAEQIFERRLRNSEIFKKEFTRIETYTPSREVENLKSFTLRVRLKNPLPANYSGGKTSGVIE